MRNQERGASYWPFIISLVLLLIFVFLWYDQKGTNDTQTTQIKDLRNEVETANKATATAELHNERVAEAVGFATFSGAGGKLWVSFEDIKKALDPTVAGSVIAQLIEASKVRSTKAFYANKKMPNPPAATELATLPPAFKDKLTEAKALFPKEAPMPPADDDDATTKAQYEAELQAYNAQFAAFHTKMDELVAMKDEFKKYSPVLGAPVLYDPDRVDAVIWEFFPRPPVAQITVEDFLKLPTPIIKDIVSAFLEKSTSLQSQIDTVTTAKLALEKIVDNSDETAKGLTQQLAETQAARTADVSKLTKEATDAMAVAESARVELTSAQNELAQKTESFKGEKAKDKQNIDALEQARRENKQRYDWEIARNDPDGVVLGADNATGVVYINLGSGDKVYPGLKFGVSGVGKGALPVPKGEIVVTKVLDVHYSQARISSRGLAAVIQPRDSIANPFFNANRPVRVYLAGGLRKFPKEIAVERLKQMGAIVVDKLDASLDIILIPDSIAAKVPATGEALAEGEDAPPPAEESEFDRLTRLAKNFGAAIVTERMVEAFFGY